MGHSTHNLAALIGSRICHDLISPIGAIGNGLELLQMAQGASEGPEMDLISDSVDNAKARIRYFRIAFGAAMLGQMIGRSEVVSVLEDISRGGRLSYGWGPAGDSARADVRLVFLALMCFESAMPLGGRITISQTGAQWQLECVAKTLRIEDRLWENLSRPAVEPDVSPSEVQFALLPVLLADSGRRLTAQMTQEDIVLRF